jgi:hypothetical protein
MVIFIFIVSGNRYFWPHRTLNCSPLFSLIATAKVIHFYRFINLMRSSVLFFFHLLPILAFSQLFDQFTDGNFSHNPEWIGTTANFRVNSALQLQSAATAASASYLFTRSKAVESAGWECTFIIDYPTSSTNFACMYLISDQPALENGLNGYYVQVGGTADEVSLYLQEGHKKTKIIDGTDKRTDGKPVHITVKVLRDSAGVFSLYSRLAGETDFYFEGETLNTTVIRSEFFGLSFTNTATTGNAYVFDDVMVTGREVTDVHPPEILSTHLSDDRHISIRFSEEVVFGDFRVNINQELAAYTNFEYQKQQLHFSLTTALEKSKIHHFEIEGVSDKAGHALANPAFSFVLTEPLAPGDIVFNEVMFHQPDNSYEYIEFYNRSHKLIDCSGLVFTTRKSDGSLNTGQKLPPATLMAPATFLCVTAQPDSLRNYHQPPDSARLLKTGWSTLNNETAILVLTNPSRDTIIDEFQYFADMHHVLIRNPKGVALERIDPFDASVELRNWHSASSLSGYGTPGYRNSQHREHGTAPDTDRFFKPEKAWFSPDNDGTDDLFVLWYEFPENGYSAQFQVLNAGGERVYATGVNEIAGTSGKWIWNGSTLNRAAAPPGIYIVVVEWFQLSVGKRGISKIPLVLASQ